MAESTGKVGKRSWEDETRRRRNRGAQVDRVACERRIKSGVRAMAGVGEATGGRSASNSDTHILSAINLSVASPAIYCPSYLPPKYTHPQNRNFISPLLGYDLRLRVHVPTVTLSPIVDRIYAAPSNRRHLPSSFTRLSMPATFASSPHEYYLLRA